MINRNPLSRQEPIHKAPALRALFPSLVELRLELQFAHDANRPPSDHVHILHPAASASFRYPCPIGGCTGHFNLDSAIMRLLRSAQATLASEATCGGVRPQDRVTGKQCESSVKFRAVVTYAGAAAAV